MRIALAIAIGFLLDLMFGDAPIGRLPHPVVVMGSAIERLEPPLRGRFPATPGGEFRAGCVLAALLPMATLAVGAGAYAVVKRISPVAGLLVQAYGCWQALALRGLDEAGASVSQRLEMHDLEGARQAVGCIVGRDTDHLDEAAITRATVETIAENFSDGVVAPLGAMVVGGAPAALAYKAVNTLDSMVGYHNERYEYFGRASANVDDVANFIPSRIAALLWIAGALLDGQDARRAWRTWRSDRRKHPSPNSAQCESACAGALGIQLGGSSTYDGVVCDKPLLGEAVRPVIPAVIDEARRTLVVAGLIAGIGAVVIRAVASTVVKMARGRRHHDSSL